MVPTGTILLIAQEVGRNGSSPLGGGAMGVSPVSIDTLADLELATILGNPR